MTFNPIIFYSQGKGGRAASFTLIRAIGLILLLHLLASPTILLGQNSRFIFRGGVNYRFFPIDIENVPRGGYSSNGLPKNEKFWKTLSVQGEVGTGISTHWNLNLQVVARYNHLHWLQGENLTTQSPDKRPEKKNLKMDLVLLIERQFPLKKNTEHALFTAFGLGLTNINTRYSVFLQDTIASGPTQGNLYEGEFTHFGPFFRVGYQYKSIRISFDTNFIEGPDRTNLTAIWMGVGIVKEIRSRKEWKTKYQTETHSGF